MAGLRVEPGADKLSSSELLQCVWANALTYQRQCFIFLSAYFRKNDICLIQYLSNCSWLSASAENRRGINKLQQKKRQRLEGIGPSFSGFKCSGQEGACGETCCGLFPCCTSLLVPCHVPVPTAPWPPALLDGQGHGQVSPVSAVVFRCCFLPQACSQTWKLISVWKTTCFLHYAEIAVIMLVLTEQSSWPKDQAK